MHLGVLKLGYITITACQYGCAPMPHGHSDGQYVKDKVTCAAIEEIQKSETGVHNYSGLLFSVCSNAARACFCQNKHTEYPCLY